MKRSIVLSGKDVSKHVYEGLNDRISSLRKKNCIPGLAVILVGENPASKVYVNSKTKIFERLELFTKTFKLPSITTSSDLITLITSLNNDSKYHGILVQLPLPKHIRDQDIINVISPKKDVDGFHPQNSGLLSIGKPRFIPCTPKGIMRILDFYKIDLSGKHVVVVGRSNIVGRPISILCSLKNKGANATVTICHSGSVDIKKYTNFADVIVVALGVPNFLDKSMVKKESIIVDVGINRIKVNNKKGYKLVGDANWDDLLDHVSAITPVPGGVGLMTIAMLVENTIEAAENLS